MQVQCLRQQRDQFTALECIYLDQFQVIKETAPYKFNVLCKPYKGNTSQYQINLMFEFTHKYPRTPIKYELEPIAGLTRDNVIHIHAKIDQIIANNNHKPVVYDIVEQTRNWIHQYLVQGKSTQAEESLVVIKEAIYQRPKFAAFTPVTVENFLAWKKEFDAKHRVEKDKGKKETEIKISGKEWFLGKHDQQIQESQDSQEQSEDEEEEVVDVRPAQVQNELFQN